MSPSETPRETQSMPLQSSSTSSRALEASTSTSREIPDGEPRGEVFEWMESAPATGASSPWGWPLFIGLGALAYCLYLMGILVGASSRQPLPVTAIASGPAPKIRVQIAGQVRKPGVYELSAQARVQDLIKKAGGPLPNADIGALNLAAWPQDGTKITVPLRVSARPTPIVIVREVRVPVQVPVEVAMPQPVPQNQDQAGLAPRESPLRPFGALRSLPLAPSATTKSGAKSANATLEFLRKNPLDLNRAPAAQLEQLPGIGVKTAERILAYREENGGFKRVDELDQVKGIGPAKLAKIKKLVYVR